MKRRAEYLASTGPHELPGHLLAQPAEGDTVIHALEAVELLTGHQVSANRKAIIALALTSRGWTKAEVLMACRALAFDETLRSTLAYQGMITPADFERVRREASDVAEVQLMTYHEMRERFEQLGGSVHLPMKQLLATVETSAGKRWRLRSVEERQMMRGRIAGELEPTEEPSSAPKDERSGDRQPKKAIKYFPPKPEDWQKDD